MSTASANYMTVEPRLMPRGPVDAAVGVAAGMFQLAVLGFGVLLPAAAAGWITENPFVVLTILAATILGLPLVLHLVVVQRLRCDDEGLAFVKGFGRAKKIRWADVQSVEPATRAEVVRGWLWPFSPTPEMTATLTSTGHYRVRWNGGVAYFPPRDAARFVYAIQIGWECAKAQPSA